MMSLRWIYLWLAVLLVLVGCSVSPTADPSSAAAPPPTAAPTMTATLTPAPTAIPTSTPMPTLTPTETPVPVVPISIPPLDPPASATGTVCAAGCDFVTIQAALDSPTTPDGAVIEVADPVHTEAGIVIEKSVTIRGLGADATVVQAHERLVDSPERVFLITEGVTVTLAGMTIRHGRPGVEDEHGGGVMNWGNLTVRNCVITANSAVGGGGISSRQAALTIIGSTISDNVARGDGPRGMECGGGGGVKCSSGTMRLINSTVVDNQAGIKSEGLGGGIRTGCGCTAEIVNCTISGNGAVRYGGGIAAGGTVQVVHCTMTGNRVGGGGGALWIRGQVSVDSSIIAGNLGGKGCVVHADSGGEGTLVASRQNLIGDGSCEAEFSGDPLLGPLADNGGAATETGWTHIPLTHGLLPGSPAMDAAPCGATVDQRWMPRPGGQASSDTPCDIGAFEVQVE